MNLAEATNRPVSSAESRLTVSALGKAGYDWRGLLGAGCYAKVSGATEQRD